MGSDEQFEVAAPDVRITDHARPAKSSAN